MARVSQLCRTDCFRRVEAEFQFISHRLGIGLFTICNRDRSGLLMWLLLQRRQFGRGDSSRLLLPGSAISPDFDYRIVFSEELHQLAPGGKSSMDGIRRSILW